MQVFIAEKPSVAMDIAKAIGGEITREDGYVTINRKIGVTWCIGHLLSQAEPEAYGEEYQTWNAEVLPVVPKKWLMVPNSKTKKQLRVIGNLISKADSVVHCGDAAREGQLIVDEILDYFSYKGPVRRLWLQEMNTQAIKNGLQKLRDNKEYQGLYESALARSRADWLMGMNLTRGCTSVWRSQGNTGTLHVGRVQTPTLCMIVTRDVEIENFRPVPYFDLGVIVNHMNGTFRAKWRPSSGCGYLDEVGRVLIKKIAEDTGKKSLGSTGKVTNFNTKTKKISAPLPFSLGELQKECNKTLGLSPSETLKVAQSLYEKHKLTTYPRTDYSHLPEDEHGMSETIIENAQISLGENWDFKGTPDFRVKSQAWDSSKIGDHHAIRPTGIKHYELSGLTKLELSIYKLIVRNFLAQFYECYEYEASDVEIISEAEVFNATGVVAKIHGWKVLFGSEEKENSEENEKQILPGMSIGDKVLIEACEVLSKKTKAPQRFNGASIIDAMENAHLFVADPKVKAKLKKTGIGTPATRAAIVDNLVDREYIAVVKDKGKNHYVSTEKGRVLYKAVPQQLRKPDITAYFEELIKSIEKRELGLSEFIEHQVQYISKLINDIKCIESQK